MAAQGFARRLRAEGWPGEHNRVRFHVGVATLATFAAVSFFVGVAAARAGNVVALRYCLLFGVTMALVIAYGMVGRYRRVDLAAAVRTVQLDGLSGTAIRYSAWQFTIIGALTACLALFCGMAAIEIFVHQDEGFPGASVIVGAFSLMFTSLGAAVALGRIRRGEITLSSQGIAQRGWSFESRLDWPAVAGVKPAFNGYPLILVIGYTNTNWIRRTTTRLWRIDRLPPVPMIEVDCRRFDVDPHALYRFVQTYVDNPELRGELGTEAALTRARRSQHAC